jgi:hypothetical protein
VYPLPSTVPPIAAHSFYLKKNARDYPIRKCDGFFFQQPYPGATRRAVHITYTPVPTREVFEKKDFGTSPSLIISTMAVSDLETKFSTLKIGVPQNRYISKRACSQYLSDNTTL